MIWVRERISLRIRLIKDFALFKYQVSGAKLHSFAANTIQINQQILTGGP